MSKNIIGIQKTRYLKATAVMSSSTTDDAIRGKVTRRLWQQEGVF